MTREKELKKKKILRFFSSFIGNYPSSPSPPFFFITHLLYPFLLFILLFPLPLDICIQILPLHHLLPSSPSPPFSFFASFSSLCTFFVPVILLALYIICSSAPQVLTRGFPLHSSHVRSTFFSLLITLIFSCFLLYIFFLFFPVLFFLS